MSQSSRQKLGQPQTNEHTFAKYVRILGKGKTGSRSLTTSEAHEAMSMILSNQVEDVQLGAFLMLLRVKEESSDELTGFVTAARESISAPNDIIVDLDWSSYAGKKRQLPWYLLSCFLLADQGIRVFMHGTSGHTVGRLYSESVLRALEIPIASNWHEVSEQLNNNQFAYMPLHNLCPELQRIIDLRNFLGLRSPVHTLSRLLNPLAAPCSLQSVFHPAFSDTHHLAAIKLGQQRAAVFKGEGGEIERKPEATCSVKVVINGHRHEEQWPRILKGRQPQSEELDINELVAVWRGSHHSEYGKQAVISTLAIALKILSKASHQQEALELAQQYWLDRNRSRL